MPRVATVVLALSVAQPGPPLTLEVRVFRGTEDVTAQSRVTIHHAGERDQPVARFRPGESPRVQVSPGIYDAQAIREQDSRVVGIRWAERLVVMPYPDEGGHHLEVINLTPGYGAIQVRRMPDGPPVDAIALFAATERRTATATVPFSEPFALLVVRAGRYDIQVKRRGSGTWHTDIEVPADRTRLWIVPQP